MALARRRTHSRVRILGMNFLLNVIKGTIKNSRNIFHRNKIEVEFVLIKEKEKINTVGR